MRLKIMWVTYTNELVNEIKELTKNEDEYLIIKI